MLENDFFWFWRKNVFFSLGGKHNFWCWQEKVFFFLFSRENKILRFWRENGIFWFWWDNEIFRFCEKMRFFGFCRENTIFFLVLGKMLFFFVLAGKYDFRFLRENKIFMIFSRIEISSFDGKAFSAGTRDYIIGKTWCFDFGEKIRF